MLKESRLVTIGKSSQGWMTVLHSDMEKQHRRVFLPHNCCQVSSETDRENDVKRREKGEKVWDWVNSAYPCHMSLLYQFPHCSLVAANSSSDTKTMNTHTRRRHTAYSTLGAGEHMSNRKSTRFKRMHVAGCQFTAAGWLPSSSAGPQYTNQTHLFFALLQCTKYCISTHFERPLGRLLVGFHIVTYTHIRGKQIPAHSDQLTWLL